MLQHTWILKLMFWNICINTLFECAILCHILVIRMSSFAVFFNKIAFWTVLGWITSTLDHIYQAFCKPLQIQKLMQMVDFDAFVVVMTPIIVIKTWSMVAETSFFWVCWKNCVGRFFPRPKRSKCKRVTKSANVKRIGPKLIIKQLLCLVQH